MALPYASIRHADVTPRPTPDSCDTPGSTQQSERRWSVISLMGHAHSSFHMPYTEHMSGDRLEHCATYKIKF